MKGLKYLLFFLILTASASSQAQSTDKKLTAMLMPLLKDFQGEAGIFVKNLRTGKIAEISSDTLFPTASMVKIPILLGVTKKMERGELGYHQEFIYSDSLAYPGVDMLASFKSGEKIELSKLLLLMLSLSDNTASLWLQSLSGGGTSINAILDSLGFVRTRVNSRTPGREAQREVYGWGQSTAAEMAGLMESIYRLALRSDSGGERMLRLLGRDYWDEEALSQIPPYIFVACKSGAVDESRSETALVMAPRNVYVFSIMTKNIRDKRWKSDNEAWVLTRKISRMLWNYYEPRSAWKPALPVEGDR